MQNLLYTGKREREGIFRRKNIRKTNEIKHINLTNAVVDIV